MERAKLPVEDRAQGDPAVGEVLQQRAAGLDLLKPRSTTSKMELFLRCLGHRSSERHGFGHRVAYILENCMAGIIHPETLRVSCSWHGDLEPETRELR